MAPARWGDFIVDDLGVHYANFRTNEQKGVEFMKEEKNLGFYRTIESF